MTGLSNAEIQAISIIFDLEKEYPNDGERLEVFEALVKYVSMEIEALEKATGKATEKTT
jgi:hypothetical protein